MTLPLPIRTSCMTSSDCSRSKRPTCWPPAIQDRERRAPRARSWLLDGRTQGNLTRDRGAASGRRGDRQPSSERSEAVLHVLQTEAADLGQRETGSVVDDPEGETSVLFGQRDRDADSAPAVLGGVLDGFQAAVVHGRLDLRRIAPDAHGIDHYRRLAVLVDVAERGR